MLSLVSNNDELTKIKSMHLCRAATTSEESDIILSEFPEDKIIRASDSFMLCVDHAEDIPEENQPSLKSYLKGPFSLFVSNRGEGAVSTFLLSFELESKKVEDVKFEGGGGIITDPNQFRLTLSSIAAIPFLDVFGTQIEKEKERAEKLIKQGTRRVPASLEMARAEQDKNMAIFLFPAFYKKTTSNQAEQSKDRKLGKEAVCDSLSSSLSASKGFYNALWNNMIEIYTPACRYVGEQCALGKMSL